MWKKTYGATGKSISVIAFGGMRFQTPRDLDNSAEIVLHAHARGINYFDTAPGYCEDKSEDIVGLAIKSMPRDSFYVSTKCMESDGQKVRASIERSLKRLNVQVIDFFHIWCLLRPQSLSERVDGGAVAAALKAKEQGLINHVVVSTHLGGEDIARVLDSGYFEGVTLGYNVLNFPFRAKALEAAGQRNLGVVTMNPLGGGLIPQRAELLGFLKGPQDADVVQAALRFNVSHPAVTAALVGFGSKAEIDQAVAAVENFTPYAPQHIENLKTHLSSSFEGFCTGCGYCLPCPADIEIPKLMDVFNAKILQGTDQAMRDRLKWQWAISPDAAAACIQCGECENSCTQHLPIRQRLEVIAALAQAAGPR